MQSLTTSLTRLLLVASSAALVSGCLDDSRPNDRTSLTGSVVSGGGSQAVGVAAATVTLYRAGIAGGSVEGTGVTDASGNFSVTIPVNPDPGTWYAIARKGTSIELASVIGPSTASSVVINELTTVAAAYAMAQLFQDGQIAGKPLPLQIAAAMAENLVAARTGTPSAVIQSAPNADQTNTWRALGTLSNILAACVQGFANACSGLFALSPSVQGVAPTTTLGAILNIARNPAANVAGLFALGNVVQTYQPFLTAAQGPAASDLLQRLDGWTLAVKVNATGGASCPFGGPGNIAFDKNGYAWITNNTVQGTPNSSTCMMVLKPDGRPADGANNTPVSPIFGGGILGQGFGVTVDPAGNIWAGNFGWGNLIPTGSVSAFTATGAPISPSAGFVDGLQQVQGTVADQKNNIWMASLANNAVVVFPNGNPASGFPPYVDANVHPFDVVIADDGSGWVTYQGSSTLSKFTFTPSALVRQFTVPLGTDGNPKGAALDSVGNVWVAAGKTSLVFAVRPNGTQLGAFNGGGIDGPWGTAVDARDNIWVANFGGDEDLGTKHRVSRLCGVSLAHCPPGKKTGDPISPPTGYTLPSAGSQVLLANGNPLYGPGRPPSYKPLMRLTAVEVDMAGNLWAVNNWKPNSANDVVAQNPGGDGVVIFVGLAAPVKAPAIGQPQSP